MVVDLGGRLYVAGVVIGYISLALLPMVGFLNQFLKVKQLLVRLAVERGGRLSSA